MKYRCLGPFINDGKEYKAGDIIEFNKEVNMKGVLAPVFEQKVEKTEVQDVNIEEISPKIEEKVQKPVKKVSKPTPKRKK